MTGRGGLTICVLYVTGARRRLERLAAEWDKRCARWVPVTPSRGTRSRLAYDHGKACLQLQLYPDLRTLSGEIRRARAICDGAQSGFGRRAEFHADIALGVDWWRALICPKPLLEECARSRGKLTFHFLPCEGEAWREHKLGILYSVLESVKPGASENLGSFRDRTVARMREALRESHLRLRRGGRLELFSYRITSKVHMRQVTRAMELRQRARRKAAAREVEMTDRLLFILKVGAQRPFTRAITFNPALLKVLVEEGIQLEFGAYI